MDARDLPYLPTGLGSLSPSWPMETVKELKELQSGRVNSGHDLALAIARLRNSLSLTSNTIAHAAYNGYVCFFDQIMPKEESRKWFQQVVPTLGNLLLRLPSLLETNFQNADMDVHGDGVMLATSLRILHPQQPGIVFLTQELIAALLACSLFCLFPVDETCVIDLQKMNFDKLFASMTYDYTRIQEHKIWCIIHYFQRISSDMPKGIVSFERKVLPFENDSIHITYPDANFWSTSVIPLCKFEVHYSGGIEDQSNEAVEVDFADPYLGGIVLTSGCLQEEIRFVINPELIAGMLFFPPMANNEAIEIVGVERFSRYTGYSSSFRFSGDYVDERDVDILGRRKTRIVAIDALCCPGTRQYTENSVLREINKAFCGFLFQCKYVLYQKVLLENGCSSALGNNVGVATGNWGCGVFGGDPEIKIIIQWLAASQAQRPFIAYYTFGLEALKNLDKVVHWISSQNWMVGDLWKELIEYSRMKLKGEINVGFLGWLQRR
ncbi:hypothetical protein VNO78_16655 [Psophocarpus tetragonolobus]|uniref:poly(ADP-ribose) glycohydrolase n=1 Tax=Psophocarpus tetragonolobus TaxID=3891 RepID=A0AAN9SGY8_PSOTE